MAAKMSKELVDLGRSCRFLLTALFLQGRRVAGILLESVTPHREEGDEEPSFFGSVVALGRRLEVSMKELAQAGAKVYAVNVRLTELRKLRVDLTRQLADAIVRLRRFILSQFVEPNMVALGLQSTRVRGSETLTNQTARIEEAFASDQLEQWLGERVEGEGLPADLEVMAARPVKVAEELRMNLVEVDEAQRELDEAVIEKDELKEKHGVLFVYTARSFEAFCRLAGLRKLAEKVRPSEEQPGRRAQEVEDPPPEPEPVDGEPIGDDEPGVGEGVTP